MSNFIEESNVSIIALSLHLERAVVKHELQDDAGIYVIEDNWFPFWIKILKQPGLIGFITYINFRKSSTRIERLELANQYNCESYMVAAFVNDDILKMTHTISYRDGLLNETLIRVCRQFSRDIGFAIAEFDPEYKILMRLTETQSVEEENE